MMSGFRPLQRATFRAARLALLACLVVLAACNVFPDPEPFIFTAIPDNDAARLQRRNGALAIYLNDFLGVPVVYQPVATTEEAIAGFAAGDFDMIWVDALAGVQARAQLPEAFAALQRDGDQRLASVFVANANLDIAPINSVADLVNLQGNSFSFGANNSLSGHYMPRYFLLRAGVNFDGFANPVGYGFSDASVLTQVSDGVLDSGVIDADAWASGMAGGQIDINKVRVLFTTPTYHNHHWLIRPNLDADYEPNFTEDLIDLISELNPAIRTHAEVLDPYDATAFIETSNDNYAEIEAVARELGLLPSAP